MTPIPEYFPSESPSAAWSIVDLTHPLDDDVPRWPGDPPFRRHVDFDGTLGDDTHYFIDSFAMGAHVGTHIDAPRHMNPDGQSVDRLPLERLIAPGVCLDFSQLSESQIIDADDIRRWEADHGMIPGGRIVLIRTDHSRHWPDPIRYYGAMGDDDPARARLRFPGLSPAAARWLVEDRAALTLGLDTPGVDPGHGNGFAVHKHLCARQIPALENLTNLDCLPPDGFMVAALPLAIRGGSGGPVRAVALIPRRDS